MTAAERDLRRLSRIVQKFGIAWDAIPDPDDRTTPQAERAYARAVDRAVTLSFELERVNNEIAARL